MREGIALPYIQLRILEWENRPKTLDISLMEDEAYEQDGSASTISFKAIANLLIAVH